MDNSRMVRGFDATTLSHALEMVHVGTWSWDVRTDRVDLSDEMFRMVGLSPGAIYLHLETLLSFVHPDDRERVARALGRSLKDKSAFRFDHRVVRRDGTTTHHDCRGAVDCDASGEVVRVVGTCIDITARVLQEDSLRESEARFRSIFEQSAVGMAIAGPDGVFISANPAFASFLGYNPDELHGKTFIEVTHPDDVELTRATVILDNLGQSSCTYDKRYVRKDGATVWGRASVARLKSKDGSLDGYVAVVEDINDRKKASEVLAAHREVLEKIMDHLPSMVAMFDASGTVEYLNREWERVLGWTLEEAKEIDLIAAIYPDPQEAAEAAAAIAEGEQKWVDFAPTARDGRVIQSSWAWLTLPDGRSLTIGQDMTERNGLQQQLLQAQKMEALGQLAGGVAHDFNNILTIISSCSGFLLQEVTENATAMSDVKEIMAASDRAAGLTRQLLAFSRRQLLHPEIIDVNSAIQEMAKPLRRLIDERIQLSVVPAAVISTAEVDVYQLEQVILNLVVNARDAIDGNGVITIETTNEPLPTATGPDTKCVVISVSDDGCGIDPAVADKVFDPFFTTKPVGHGTGLGLATVHGIVKQSGGHLQIESSLGKGTRINVFLPLVIRDCAPTEGTSTSGELGGTETILLVEDETALRSVMRRVLAGLGYTILEARHGADGARICAEYPGEIDLLLTDVVMPEMGGQQLAQIFRAQRPGTPVLYASGYTDDELLRSGILEPGAELLRKPFVPLELALRVRSMLHVARRDDSVS